MASISAYVSGKTNKISGISGDTKKAISDMQVFP